MGVRVELRVGSRMRVRVRVRVKVRVMVLRFEHTDEDASGLRVAHLCVAAAARPYRRFELTHHVALRVSQSHLWLTAGQLSIDGLADEFTDWLTN